MTRLALIQMVSGERLEENLRQLLPLLTEASVSGASMAVLPENFALFDSAALRPFAEREKAEAYVQGWLAEQAKRLRIWIVAGSLPQSVRPDGSELEAPLIRSASLVFDARGERVARYDKIHLFDVDVADGQGSYRESAYVEAGEQLVVIDTPCGRLGLTVCYDLRFPDQYQRLREMGAELISVPSAFTYVTGEAHWEVLLRARAVENQCYLLGVNQGGWHSERRQTWGHTLCVDPWGTVCGQIESGAGVLMVDISLERLAEIRQQMPVLAHKQQAEY